MIDRTIQIGVVDDEIGAGVRLRRDFADHADLVPFDVAVIDEPRLDSINSITTARLSKLCTLDVILIDNLLPQAGTGDRKREYGVALLLRIVKRLREREREHPSLPILCTNDPNPNLARSFSAYGGAHVVDKNERREIVSVVVRAVQGERFEPPALPERPLTAVGRALLPLVEKTAFPIEIKMLCEQLAPTFNMVDRNPSRLIEQELLARYRDQIAPDFGRADDGGGIRKQARRHLLRRPAGSALRVPLARVLELVADDGYSWVPYDDMLLARDEGVEHRPGIALF